MKKRVTALLCAAILTIGSSMTVFAASSTAEPILVAPRIDETEEYQEMINNADATEDYLPDMIAPKIDEEASLDNMIAPKTGEANVAVVLLAGAAFAAAMAGAGKKYFACEN